MALNFTLTENCKLYINNALVIFVKMVCKGEPRGMAELVDATDLGSVGWKHLCGFESHYPYTKNHNQ